MHAARSDGRWTRNFSAQRRQSFAGRAITKQGWRKRSAARIRRKGLPVAKKKKSEWEGAPAPECPNNSRHNGLVPHERGGYVCEECLEAKTSRSREIYRWAFAEGGLDE